MNELDPGLLAENQEILDRFVEQGSDLAARRIVDFEHLFEQRSHAEAFLRKVEEQGYKATLYDRDDGLWDAQASCEMVPTAAAITEAEQALGQLATIAGGKADGWGFYRSNP